MAFAKKEMTSSPSSNSASSCANNNNNGCGGEVEGSLVPIIHDALTFENRQQIRLRDMERKIDDEIKKRTREWDRDVQFMREEFLDLYPSNSELKSGTAPNDPLVATRRGSTDILDVQKMKALFLEYPDSGRRCKLRFNVSGMNPETIRVTADSKRIIVSAVRVDQSSGEGGPSVEKEYSRKIEKPKEVDHTKLKSYLTTDGILIVEAPLPPATLNLRKVSQSPSRSLHGSNSSIRSRSPAFTPTTAASGAAAAAAAAAAGGGGTGCAAGSTVSGGTVHLPEKQGVPLFRDDNGRRKFFMALDIGSAFTAKEVTIQIIKDTRIQVKAKHEERTSERLSKNKLSKDFELAERILTYSLRSGVTNEGRLMIAALVKGHAAGLNKITAGDLIVNDLNARAENQPCNVLDLSTFPPTTPAMRAAAVYNPPS